MADLEITLTREETARREIGHTEAGAAACRLLAALFLATVFAVPAVQHVSEIRGAVAGGRAAAPQCYDIFAGAARALRAAAAPGRPLHERVLAANRTMLAEIHRYEDELEDRSVLRAALLPPVQTALVRYAGVGNEQVLCGRSGWLFYRADADYVTGPPFLESGVRAARTARSGDTAWRRNTDAVEAVVDFAVQLARRDITLVLMPTPAKPTVHPEKLSARAGDAPVQNGSFEPFLRRVRQRFLERMQAGAKGHAARLLIFDPAPLLADRAHETGLPQYLETDTHWRPEAMEFCAEQLARLIEDVIGAPERRIAFRRRSEDVSNSGDLARMLNLPAGTNLYTAETVRIHPVFDPQEATWQPDRSAPVLLLGDSFTNIYAFDAMAWGFSAGLAEQLSYHLGRPVDRIVRNDGGAHATRALLAAELAAGRDRLAAARVVVWQFAARELADGDWPLINLALGRARADKFLELGGAEEMTVTASIAAITPVPRPRSQPYADYILALHLTGVKPTRGAPAGRQAVAYLWAMRANVWTAAARLRTDQEVRLRLRSWERVKREKPALAAVHRGELGPELDLEPALWADLVNDEGRVTE